MLKTIRSNADLAGRTLVIGGPFEFISSDGQDHAMEASFAPLVKAYDALGYNSGAMSMAEAAKFQSLGIAPPHGWVTLDPKEPRTVILAANGHKVGVVYFPEGKHPDDLPAEDTLSKVSRALKELRPQVALLVGVSPWGSQATHDYLEKTAPDLDILLGAGLGVGFMARPALDGKVLLAHAYYKGKAIYAIDVLALPGAKDFKWVAGTNFSSKAVALDEAFPPDPDMERLLQGVQDPGDKH